MTGRPGLPGIMVRVGLVVSLVAGLTLVTQVGGVALVLAMGLRRAVWRRRGPMVTAGLAVVLYAVASLTLVPVAAAAFGRVPLACFGAADAVLQPRSLLYCALNRHYVTPRLRSLARALARAVAAAHPGRVTVWLDANFPFADGFPLLPHLSHDDGRKLDLAFHYRDGGRVVHATPSPIGYWGFEPPRRGDPQPCAGRRDRLSLRWDMAWMQSWWPDLTLDEPATATMVEWLIRHGPGAGLERMLLEPHLQRRLGVASPLLRFQGCRAARHDDHLHIQVRP